MMSEESIRTALKLVKIRLNRADTALDEYLESRVKAAIDGLNRIGITLTDSTDDIMLAVDYTVWQYGNRDKPDSMPEWLRLMRRERWLAQRRGEQANDT